MTEPKRGRGRPIGTTKPDAKSSSERVKEWEKNLVDSGGRIIRQIRLTPEANAALKTFEDEYKTPQEAIYAAILEKGQRHRR
ncbi:hypothetical protein LMG16407_00481 [Pandoraea apista]|nr:hypothetical protein AT395_25365 [Pandoraea apista]CFB60442.1 hypothetical protein LMG16407_00481 [Pandoraea apista]